MKKSIFFSHLAFPLFLFTGGGPHDGCSEAFEKTQHEIEIANRVEAPAPPFDHDPKHQDNAADKDGEGGQTMSLDEQISRSELCHAVYQQQRKTRGDKITEEHVRPGHFGSKHHQQLFPAPFNARGKEKHHHGSADSTYADEECQHTTYSSG